MYTIGPVFTNNNYHTDYMKQTITQLHYMHMSLNYKSCDFRRMCHIWSMFALFSYCDIFVQQLVMIIEIYNYYNPINTYKSCKIIHYITFKFWPGNAESGQRKKRDTIGCDNGISDDQFGVGVCLGLSSGYKAHPCDCSKYFVCGTTGPTVLNCGNLDWDQNAMTCVIPEQGLCGREGVCAYCFFFNSVLFNSLYSFCKYVLNSHWNYILHQVKLNNIYIIS